ncbi:calpain-A-like isoform X2 [Tenebrio molitor]|uniref:calpain-A-like isoform X2 n=1 Tax=Tenebrio molitor TaxID=7067 RepID=UPI003624746B
MHKSQRDKVKSETFYHVLQKSNNENETEPQQTDVVDAPLNYQGFKKIYMLGEKNSGTPARRIRQDYSKLRESCVRKKSLFVDGIFSPKFDDKIVVKRPSEISDHPQFITDGATRFDINQGTLADCWFLAAVANLTLNHKLLAVVVPTDQSFSNNYAGIFHFRFWQYGRWIDVVIDDTLPTDGNKLVYLRSTDPNEYWPSLLEKAYAKLYGSYKNLEGGLINEALEDLCGGLSEFYSAKRLELYEIMEMSYKRSSFMGCSITASEKEGQQRGDGLITMHAYSVTDMETIKLGQSEIRLIRLRNPWGGNAEWNGAWSDNSENWDLVPKEVSKRLRVKRYDGEFWMAIEDFQRCFTSVEICHLNPSTFIYGEDSRWYVNMFENRWIPNVTAGETFANNPQYFLTVRGNNSTCTVVIGLMQENRRLFNKDNVQLELTIFKIKADHGHHLGKDLFKSNSLVLNHKETVVVRQLTVRISLPSGKYCIVPSTASPNEEAYYLLRIYSEMNINVKEPIPARKKKIWSCH